MALQAGSHAPDFSLKTRKEGVAGEVRLSDYRGKANVVLCFFPFAFSSVCTQELCDLSGGLGAYESLHAEVIAISVDSPYAQEAWAKQEKISLTLASDLNKKTAAAYGVLLEDVGGCGSAAARAVFVIDREGVIRYAEQTATPKDLPNFQAVQARLAELK